jgi:hypothetical protein
VIEVVRVKVECQPGHRDEPVPCAFFVGDRRIEVVEILDRWPGRDHRYFKIRSMDPMSNDQQRPEPVTILVVEADPLRRRWIEHALSGGGYDVKTVSSAKQGLKCLKRIRFDVVVIGGHLRAIGLTEWLSETKRLHPELPVIVNEVKWPVGREYLMGSPGGFHCLVRSLQTEELAFRERIEEVVRGRQTQSVG